MAGARRNLPIRGIALLVLIACGISMSALENASAAPARGKNALIQEREVRDALISNPPFTGTAAEQASAQPVAPAPSPASIYAPPPHPASVQETVQHSAPSQPASVYVPAPPPATAIPELMVRGYSVERNGVVNIIGMDGLLRAIDASRPVKLVFPPEYGLAPQIVGGTTRAVAPPPIVMPVEIAVRGYSIDPSGHINIIGVDGVLRTIDGSRPVKLVFPPEYGLAPQIVGGGSPAPQEGSQAFGAEVMVSQPPTPPPQAGIEVRSSGTLGDLPAALIQEGVGVMIRQMQKGKKSRD
ncbi:MAG: hypothetical protein AAGU11_07525 [Syntrophobacteraceae bacterium]